jgi:predicted enzyme related to lactoylglutathione lyase
VGFCRYELRTTDLSAARDFYIQVFGPEFWDSGVGVTPLPEAAAARGAPAHWLGYIGVSDVAGTADRFQRLGGQALRDPFGAVLALGSETEARESPVVLQVHHSLDRERALDFYSGLFGPADGPMFVSAPSPEIHPQWLFFFRVPGIERSMERVRALGGLVLEPTQTPNGDVVVACDDPQGAAFGLISKGMIS